MKSRALFAPLSLLLFFAVATPSALARSTYQVRAIVDNDIVNFLGDGITHAPGYSAPLNTIGGGDAGDGIRWFSGFDASATTSDGKQFTVFQEGIILSTGKAVRGIGNTNEASDGPEGTGPNFWSQQAIGDQDLSEYFGGYLRDVAGIILYIIPSNHTINIPLIVASEEYFLKSEYYDDKTLEDYQDFDDAFAFFVEEGHITNSTSNVQFTNNIAKLAGDIDLSIGSVNPYTNQQYFVANVDVGEPDGWGYPLNFPSDNIPIPFQYNGLMTGPCAVMTNAVPGREYTIKIIVGDGGGDGYFDTAVFLKSKGITSGADLKLTVTADPTMIDEVADGKTGTFTFVVENIGPAPAWGVELTNSVPVCEDGAWTWTEPEVWQLPDLPSGASYTNTLVVTFGDAAVNYSELTVSGIVVTATGDYDMSNNADSATIGLDGIPPSSISGFVWDDVDQDGVFSNSETNLIGVAVSLYTNAVSSTPFRTTTTDDDGYFFDLLPRGEYIVVFDAPDGYSGFSTKHAIDDPGVNSDAEAGEPLLRSQTDVLEIAVDGETVDNVNAAVYRVFTVIPALKIWEDENNQDGIRPDSVTLSLCTNGMVIATADATNGDWSVYWENFPKYVGTNVIEYIVREDDVPAGYTVDIEYNGQMWEVVNHHTPSNVTVSMTKIWDDDANRDGIRPREVSFTLFGITDGGVSTNLVATTNILASAYAADVDEWPFAWENLPMCAAGEPIVYAVREEPLSTSAPTSLYTPFVSPEGPYDFSITNSYTPETIAVTVEKVWDDADNRDNIRPTATFTLLADGIPVGSTFTTTDSILTNTWTDLPKYVREAGETREIEYTVEENSAPLAALGYETSFGKADNYWTFTNSYTPATVSVTATKVWDDAGDQDGVRPDTVTLSLYADGEKIDSFDATGDSLTKTWEGLPKFVRLDNVSTNIDYDVREDSVPDYYTASCSTNVLPNGFAFTITNTHTTDTVSVSVEKVWDDADDQDLKRPASVTLTLYAGGVRKEDAIVSAATDWKATWPGLDKSEGGTNIVYDVREDDVPDDYKVSCTTNVLPNGFAFTITNTHTTEVVTVRATKSWVDDDDRDRKRPETVTLTLTSNDVAVATADVSEPGSWSVSWVGLAKNFAGMPIAYGVIEADNDVPEGYSASVVTNGLYDFTVVNTHELDTIDVTATKVWVDDNNRDGFRPVEVSFSLYAGGVWETNAVVSEATGWTTTWSNLVQRSAGTNIVYTVQEDTVPGYYTNSWGNVENVWSITNTHEIERRTITARKMWDDADNQDGFRPDSVTLSLCTNGFVFATAAATNDDWSVRWEDIPVYAGGHVIEYTVREDDVPPDYENAGAELDGEIWQITNRHVPSNVTVTVTKVWDDDSNRDGIRPPEVVFTLLEIVDGGASENVISTTNILASAYAADADEWPFAWEGLPMFSAGERIVYGVREEPIVIPDFPPTAYTPAVVTNGLYDFTFTNTHIPPTVTVTVSKVWDDADNQDGIRPASVTFSLLSNNVAVASAALSADTGWTNAWTGLSERSAGTPIQWSVEESPVPNGYTPSSLNSGNDWTFTNTHVPSNVTVTAKKEWNDGDNQDGIRPNEVTFSLLSNNVSVASVVVTAGNGWTNVWADLPQCDSGSPIAYGVREDSVPEGYTPSVVTNGPYDFTVVNTHAPSNTTVTVKKVWNDADNQDGKRPASVTLSLYANGVKVREFAASGSNLSKTWSDLPANAAGTPIDYTVQEDSVPAGYYVLSIVKTATANGFSFVVTNRHPPVPVDIVVTKVWDDENDGDKLRPSSVSVSLKANGTVVKTAALSAGGGWTTTWTGLPKYANGSAIQYTVVENSVPSGYSNAVSRVSTSTGYTFTVTNTHQRGEPKLKTTATWTLNRSDGLIYGTFTLKNTGKKAFASNTDFWLATPGSGKTWYIYNPTGKMPDGSAYYNFTSAVRAAAKKVGNKNTVLDPGESVSVSGVQIYHKSRISPAEYLDVQKTTHAGRLFHTSDSNKNFVISSSELKAAQKAWSAGTLSDDDLLEATRLAAGAAYLWNDSARNWKTLSKDKR